MSFVTVMAKNGDIDWKACFISSILMGNLIDLDKFFCLWGLIYWGPGTARKQINIFVKKQNKQQKQVGTKIHFPANFLVQHIFRYAVIANSVLWPCVDFLISFIFIFLTMIINRDYI